MTSLAPSTSAMLAPCRRDKSADICHARGNGSPPRERVTRAFVTWQRNHVTRECYVRGCLFSPELCKRQWLQLKNEVIKNKYVKIWVEYDYELPPCDAGDYHVTTKQCDMHGCFVRYNIGWAQSIICQNHRLKIILILLIDTSHHVTTRRVTFRITIHQYVFWYYFFLWRIWSYVKALISTVFYNDSCF